MASESSALLEKRLRRHIMYRVNDGIGVETSNLYLYLKTWYHRLSSMTPPFQTPINLILLPP
jgi:hypothetical protein